MYMKLLIATQQRVSRYATRAGLLCMALVVSVAVPISFGSDVYADRFDDQLRSLQAQANQAQAQANQYRAQADTLQNKLNQITAEKTALEAQIQISQAKQAQLTADIAANTKKMEDAQSALGETLANLYVDGKVSALEMLASSQNIGDYIDKQSYRSTVRDHLKQSIDSIKAIKKQLEDDKKALEKVLSELDAQNKQLAAAQAEQQSLVDQTRGEEAAYQNLVNNTKSQMADITAQQRSYYQSLIASGNSGGGVVGAFTYTNLSPSNGAGGCSGGYPGKWCVGQDTVVDDWGLYNRECVSYVAWALESRFGKRVNNFRGQGNAYQWPSAAAAYSGAYRVADPQPGDVVVLPQSGSFAPVGHVMIVESVNNGWMRVSQFNFYGTGQYSTMDVKNSGVILLRFKDR